MKAKVIKALLVFVLATTSIGLAGDWPQWRGPNRDGISTEKGLMKEWPLGGPKMLWSLAGLGKGYSTVSVADGKIYVTGVLDEQENLFAISMDGKILWNKPYAKPWKKSFIAAKSTPTIDDGLAYVMSTHGTIVCMDAETGAIKWKIDTKKEYGLQDPIWGLAESPLIVDDKVICTPGGKSAMMLALHKKTGEVIWKCTDLKDKSAYTSALLVKRGPRELIAQFTSDHIVGVDAITGKLLWKHPYVGKCRAHINTPVYSDGRLVFTSGYDAKMVALDLSDDGSKVTEAWFNNEADTHHGGIILIDGYIYCTSWKNNQQGNWMCVDIKTGKAKYSTKWKTKGSMTSAEGMLYCYEERKGNVALVPATPKEFIPVSTMKVTLGSDQHWGHPVVCGGRLYIRHGDVLMAYDIKAR